MPGQRWWSPGHRSSPPVAGVDALNGVNEATPGFAARYGLRGCALTSARLSGNSVLWVTPHPSLKLPGRAARSRGRTSTGEFQSIHGILSGTFSSWRKRPRFQTRP